MFSPFFLFYYNYSCCKRVFLIEISISVFLAVFLTFKTITIHLAVNLAMLETFFLGIFLIFWLNLL